MPECYCRECGGVMAYTPKKSTPLVGLLPWDRTWKCNKCGNEDWDPPQREHENDWRIPDTTSDVADRTAPADPSW